MQKAFILLLTCLVMFSCGNKSTTIRDKAIKSDSLVAEIYAIQRTKNALEIKVMSSGCTKPAHFKLEYGRVFDDTVQLKIVKTKRDFCKKKPFSKSIRLELDFGNGKNSSKIVVLNPILPNPFEK